MKRPRTTPRIRLGIFAVVLVALLGGLAYAIVSPGSREVTINARFATAPGLYTGNQVRVLGMPVGHVTSIRPGPEYVTVTMTVPASVPIPANAQALILAPNVVNDRYIQLTPAYGSGPVIANGAVIPMSRTSVPLSVDEIIASLDQLSKALGPNGANAHGALSSLLASTAKAFGGTGPAVNSTITSLGGALGALSSQGGNLTALIDNIGNLTKVASQYTGTYTEFANNLASVSSNLAANDRSLGAALQDLQTALGALAGFIQTNSATLGQSVANLDTVAAAVTQDQARLAQMFGALPVALQNLDAAFTPTAGGTALTARLDPVGSSSGFSTSVCGSSLLRLLLLVPGIATVTDPASSASIDEVCGLNGVLANLQTPPGAASGPDLSLSALLGAR